ncbi:MAG: hypothetical protein HW411_1074 [Gammaproteobacteria bacterium]|nr:hypothetical protein [Gammaproteobacteria bacterium]
MNQYLVHGCTSAVQAPIVLERRRKAKITLFAFRSEKVHEWTFSANY